MPRAPRRLLPAPPDNLLLPSNKSGPRSVRASAHSAPTRAASMSLGAGVGAAAPQPRGQRCHLPPRPLDPPALHSCPPPLSSCRTQAPGINTNRPQPFIEAGAQRAPPCPRGAGGTAPPQPQAPSTEPQGGLEGATPQEAEGWGLPWGLLAPQPGRGDTARARLPGHGARGRPSWHRTGHAAPVHQSVGLEPSLAPAHPCSPSPPPSPWPSPSSSSFSSSSPPPAPAQPLPLVSFSSWARPPPPPPPPPARSPRALVPIQPPAPAAASSFSSSWALCRAPEGKPRLSRSRA